MNVLVLGAGVIGVTTAYFLHRDGARVTVLDRREGPGLETSFANGGHLAVGQATPWAAPEVPRQLLAWAGRREAPFRMRARWDPALWRWGLRFLRHCSAGHYQAATETMERLARYSQGCLDEIRRDHDRLEFGYRQTGLLTVFRNPETLARAAARRRATTEELIDVAGCMTAEPALAPAARAGRIAGGLLARSGGLGDARAFTEQLAAICADGGVTFRFGITVTSLERSGDTVTGAVTSGETLAADAVVLALASHSRGLARTAGLDLPVQPVKGYSVTLPVGEGETLPAMGVLDHDRRVVMGALGGALRAAGTAELAGYDTAIDPVRIGAICRAAAELFPAAIPLPVELDRLEPWAGLRPMTPDGPPLLGPPPPDRGCRNLVLNTGHGHLGWTLAAGSARVVADGIAGRPAAIGLQGLTLDRFH